MSDDLRRLVVQGSTIKAWTPDAPKLTAGVHWALADRFGNVVDIAEWGGGFHCMPIGDPQQDQDHCTYHEGAPCWFDTWSIRTERDLITLAMAKDPEPFWRTMAALLGRMTANAPKSRLLAGPR